MAQLRPGAASFYQPLGAPARRPRDCRVPDLRRQTAAGEQVKRRPAQLTERPEGCWGHSASSSTSRAGQKSPCHQPDWPCLIPPFCVPEDGGARGWAHCGGRGKVTGAACLLGHWLGPAPGPGEALAEAERPSLVTMGNLPGLRRAGKCLRWAFGHPCCHGGEDPCSSVEDAGGDEGGVEGKACLPFLHRQPSPCGVHLRGGRVGQDTVLVPLARAHMGSLRCPAMASQGLPPAPWGDVASEASPGAHRKCLSCPAPLPVLPI